ncbi:transketolase [Candidatus Tachikawaea gelatinosa]|uniref:Transketolase n=1 Tax=Candidatus Tachikawaea gelatinosa TaxID=1410383 RepID=A0A090AJQ1_9ENTR|nr:transketolase [Candidatus Tachikawaea gelatinosa]BAP58678.1 transketolase [Candidatus Tachikawaea gelatinosa]
MFSRKELANAIRFLSIDAIQKAKSGHPGAPMGMADIAEVLWRDYLKHNPSNPQWIDRDRFVLSNGHGSMLIYSLLHLTGYDLPLSELKNFRQLFSKTPGHPEYKHTVGIEATTGPLGQGLANAVGFAIAERTLAAQFNRPNFNIIDHYTYAFVGDGCMMEGISHEVSSLAGTLRLGKLIVFYDNNGISIDGKIDGWFKDDTAKRFEAYGWNVIKNIDGHNSEEIKKSIDQAKSINNNKPSLLICTTVIGFGSPNKHGKNEAHGAPLGEDEIILTRKKLNWKYSKFEIPDHIYKKWNAKAIGKIKEQVWNKNFSEYKKIYPQLANEFERIIVNKLPQNWEENSQKFINKIYNNPINISTREASQKTIEEFGKILSNFLGGSADLSPSNLTLWSGSKPININPAGNYIYYGVREFGMVAIANGIALHNGFIPYTATFLMFIEYAKNAVRMAALMKIQQIIICTHDSIGLGEDGPTHQPIEQLSSLRMIPNVSVWRPCDQIECAIAWKYAIENFTGPTVLVLSRQNLSAQNRHQKQIKNISRGGYILKDCDKNPELILIATGSEIDLAVSAYSILSKEGYQVRVVSMPSTDVFDKQEKYYRDFVLPPKILKRIVIEAGVSDFWYKYIGFNGIIIGLNEFGQSAPSVKLFQLFGLTVENIVNKAKKIL